MQHKKNDVAKDKVLLAVVIFIVLFIFIVVAIMIVSKSNNTYNDNNINNSELSNTDSQLNSVWKNLNLLHSKDNYECLVSEKRNDDNGYLIYYPNIKNEKIDKSLLDIVDEFRTLYSESYNDKIFTIDYKTYISSNNLLTVVFTSSIYNSDKSINSHNISTYTYKLDDGSKVEQSDIFKNSFYIFAKNKVLDELKENKELSEDAINTITDDADNFKNVAFDDKYCYILYSAYQLGLKTTNTINIKINNDDVKNYMKINFDGSKIEIQNRIRENLDKNKPMVAITFDDGPSYLYTPKLLDTIEQYDVRVTFFMVGYNISGNSDIIKRAYDLGCQIANHTANHASLAKQSVEGMIEEVESVNNQLKEIIGVGASMVRPPYGAFNDTVKQNINYPLILWNVDTEDWRTLNADLVEQAILNNAYDGAVILLHDIHSTSVEGAIRAIPQLIQQGYQLVTVEELFYYKGIEPQSGKVYTNF